MLFPISPVRAVLFEGGRRKSGKAQSPKQTSDWEKDLLELSRAAREADKRKRNALIKKLETSPKARTRFVDELLALRDKVKSLEAAVRLIPPSSVGCRD